LCIVCDLLKHYFSDRCISYEITQFENGINLLHEVEDGRYFDIVVLDIYMDKLLGIDVAHKLREIGFEGDIIFLTATSDFAVESYDVSASGYLLKPHSYPKLCKVMDKITIGYSKQSYQIHRRNSFVRVPYDEIVFVESSNSKCILKRNNGEEFVIYKRLSDIETELMDKRFLRSHRSFLVNMSYITAVDKEFTLTTGDVVLIRQKSLKKIRQVYTDYLLSMTLNGNFE
ncbi:MAG: LytTR family DNA-binding domain-containing protein, partial [Lachnospiraceae bacterium]|nr:LytTR family DNA-binding domain-containing protein [Lachnospiraceae bacterium]